MKLVLLPQILITLLGGLLISKLGAPQQGLSFAAGSLVLVISFLMMGVGYGMIFQKKLVALGAAIIVIKYAILGIIIFTLVKLTWFNPLWFSLGVASFVFSAFFYALKQAAIKFESIEGSKDGI